MTTDHLMRRVGLTSKISCESNILQTIDIIQVY